MASQANNFAYITPQKIGDIVDATNDYISSQKQSDNPLTGVLENAIDEGLSQIRYYANKGYPQCADPDQVHNFCGYLSQINDCIFLESILVKLNTTFDRLFSINFSLRKGEDGRHEVEFIKSF